MIHLNTLADEIERIARHWRGANGGIHAIHGMSVEIARHLAARASPAPDVTVEEIAREIAISYGQDPYDLAQRTVMCDANGFQVPWWMVYEEQARAIFALLKSKHRPATTRDGGDGHPCASMLAAPRGASAPDPSGQVDQASAGIDADVGALDGWKLVPEEATVEMWAAGAAADDLPGSCYCAVYRAMLAAAPTPPSFSTGLPMPVFRAKHPTTVIPSDVVTCVRTPPSPKGGNETVEGGNEPDPFAGADPSRYSGSPSYGDCPNPPDAECDSASGARGDPALALCGVARLMEIGSEALASVDWATDNGFPLGTLSIYPEDRLLWAALKSGALVVQATALAAAQRRIAELEAGLRDLETACDRRAAATSREMYLALSSTEGMLRALAEIDAARSKARALLSGGSDGR